MPAARLVEGPLRLGNEFVIFPMPCFAEQKLKRCRGGDFRIETEVISRHSLR